MRFPALVALMALGASGVVISVSSVPSASSVLPASSAQTQQQGRGRSNQPPPPPLVTTGLIVGRVVDSADGRPVAGAIVTLGGGPARSAPLTPPVPGSTQPLPPPPTPRILTDSEGRFAFRSLTRGNYSLNASKSGYAAGSYGRSRPDGPTRPLTLDDDERMNDVTIRLFKYASIAGIVTDEAGEPIVGATVRAERRVLVAGRRALSQWGSPAQTDDRGMYRLYNLAPAEYVVSVPIQSTSSPSATDRSPDARQNLSATSQNLNGPTILMAGGRQVSADGRFFWQSGSGAPLIDDGAGRWRGYATQYYLGSRTAAAAQVIKLASGEERTGVDLSMAYVPTSSISGLVIGPAGPAANYALRLVPFDGDEITAEAEVATAVTDGAGAFTFFGVPSGQYAIKTVRVPRQPLDFVVNLPGAGRGGEGVSLGVTMVQSNAPPPEPLLWATTPVSVGDTDVGGVALTLREGLSVSGRLEFTGSRPRPTPQALAQIPLVVEPASGRDNFPQNGPPSRVQPDGRFVTTPRVPGKYFLRVGGSPSGFIVQSVVVNGIDATEVPFDLTTSLSSVVVTFTDLISGVSGTVHGVTAGADAPAVVLFPSDNAAWKDYGINPMRIRMARVTAQGTFAFGSLISGDYFAVAIPDEFSGEWSDPAYLEVLARSAERFTLGAGEKRTLDLPLSTAKPPGIGRIPAPTPRPANLGSERPNGATAHGPFVDDAAAQQQPPVPPRDGRTVEAVGTGSISGVVMVNDGAPRPARLAKVSVSGSGLAGERLALTDAEGRFTVAWLPPGDYSVNVSKASFLAMFYGARRTGASGTPVHVAADQAVSGVDVTLQKGAVIAGIVLDPLGQPISGVRVQLQTYTRREGERVLTGVSMSGQFGTDDRGAYRIYGLRPGSYVVSVVPPSLATNTDTRQLSESDMRAAIADAARPSQRPPGAVGAQRAIAPAPPGDVPAPVVGGRPVGYSPIYYPGTTRVQDAAEIPLAAGQELNGVNLQLMLVPTARIEGRVIAPGGLPLANAQVLLTTVTSSGGVTNNSIRQQDGNFQSVGVPVGHYFLQAFLEQPQPRPAPPAPGAPPVPPPPPVTYWAQIEIDVNGVDLQNLVLPLAPPMTISGRVVFDSGTPPEMRSVQVRVEAAGPQTASRGVPTTSPDATGAFTLTGVMPGKYRLAASASSSTPGTVWSVVSATIGGEDALLAPFEMRTDRQVTNTVITLTDRPAELSGTLMDGQGRPVPWMTVVLFPTDRALWTLNSTRVNRTTRPGADGVFRFTSTLPGEYYLGVLTDLDPNDWSDPAFKEQLTASSIKVTVGKGEKKVQDLRIGGS